ncbi:lamin tail domain-containing protein [Halocola ammonii]
MKINRLILIALISGMFTACETDDVDSSLGGPEVSLSASTTTISENGGTVEVSLSLSDESDDQILVDLAFAGSASGLGEDYSISADVVTFNAGEKQKSITITAVQDTLEEGNESITVSISNASNAQFEPTESLAIVIEDDDVSLQSQLILNEILYDPSNEGLDGDANGDGTYAQNEDEFIELFNLSTQPLDMSGYEIFDDENLAINTPNHTVAPNTIIQPGQALVIFGGGTPTGTFGNATVQTTDFGELNLNNAGDRLTIKNADGETILTFDIEPLSNNPNESYTRNPDLTGDFVQHNTVNGILFSPGTRTDGSPF